VRRAAEPPGLLALPGRDTAEAAAYRARAHRLGLSFVSHPRFDSTAAPGPDDDIETGTSARNKAGDLIIAPGEEAMANVAAWLRRNGALRHRVSVSTPTAIRAGLRAAIAAGVLAEARTRVERIGRHFSAARTFEPRQVAALLAGLAVLGAAFLLHPVLAATLLWLLLAAFFVIVSFIRWVAALDIGARRRRRLPPPGPDTALPVYTVLVPLRHEAGMIRQIVAGLDRLAWPRDRLDVKLVIDADDTDTLAVARAHAAEAPYEVVEVPAGGPRTKPMALQYALAFARGRFVTVYDAEDRPHPGQLAEAYRTFAAAPASLACLQAPLVVDNEDDGWLASLFAIEYAALFDGLLPALADRGLPLPLGGTSNHFRRDALERVGGWDPHNVTEDADLGIRLARFGYGVGTITLPTREEAPVGLRTWLRQRTRWMKGWMQTWLVHMRHPAILWRTVGAGRFLGFNALGLGMIVSALAHPVFILTPLWILLDPASPWRGGGLLPSLFAGLTLFNLAFGYAAMWALSTRALAARGRHGLVPLVALLPAYWLLVGLATALAGIELLRAPHRWNKTPHTATRPVVTAAPARPAAAPPAARPATRVRAG